MKIDVYLSNESKNWPVTLYRPNQMKFVLICWLKRKKRKQKQKSSVRFTVSVEIGHQDKSKEISYLFFYFCILSGLKLPKFSGSSLTNSLLSSKIYGFYYDTQSGDIYDHMISI